MAYHRHFGYKYAHFGEDTKGMDVKGFGDTTGKYFLWDASADTLYVVGTLDLDGPVLVGVDDTGYDVTFFGATSGKKFFWDESADTAFLTCTVDIDGTVTVGVDDTGYDVKFFGATTGRYLLWDESADELILVDNVSLNFGTGLDVDIRWDGTDLDILAAADDSVIKFGNGTNSFDVWIYGNAATDYVLWDASANKLSLAGNAYLLLDSYQRTITAKTADYTLTAADSGGVFTTTGAGAAVNFTLPAVATSTGYEYTFINTVDQNMTITAPTGTLVVFNNAAATSIAFSTTSEKIGAAVRVTCDGAKWVAQVMLGAETQTPTIA